MTGESRQAVMTEAEYERRRDEDNLRLLSVFHYVMGGYTALVSCVFLTHFFMGIAMLNGSFGTHPNDPPQFMGWLFTLLGGGAVVTGWIVGGLTIYAGKLLQERRGYKLNFVLSCINCLQMPIGTALGVFTLIVLMRPSVKALFGVPDVMSGGAPSAVESGRPWYRGEVDR